MISAKPPPVQCGVLPLAARACSAVVMPAGTVYVAVRQLFFGRGPYLGDLDVEVEVLPGERVIAVDRDHVTDDMRDRNGAHAVGRLRVELHADLDIADALERTARDALDQGLVELTVGVGGGDFHAQLVARGLAF